MKFSATVKQIQAWWHHYTNL